MLQFINNESCGEHALLQQERVVRALEAAKMDVNNDDKNKKIAEEEEGPSKKS